jgi:hypothetical protein
MIAGRWQLPPNVAQLAERDADAIQQHFLKSKRHAIEVHYHSFLRELKGILKGVSVHS